MTTLTASRLLRSSCGILLLSLSAVSFAAPLDTTIDAVLGQSSLVTGNAGNGASGLQSPGGVAVDRATGRIFVGDAGNNRVLSWPNAASFTNGQAADLVLGQPDLIVTSPGTSATKMQGPFGIAVDLAGNVYVSEPPNNRVLLFMPPLSSGMAATRVIGQPNFTSSVANNGGISPNSLSNPLGIAVDGRGNLFVADLINNRVLAFNSPVTTFPGDFAARVYGQPSFTTNAAVAPTASSLNTPTEVAVDPSGNLWISDSGNSRALMFTGPLPSELNNPLPEPTADLVLGQSSMTVGTPSTPSSSRFAQPRGIAFDSSGTAYIGDSFGNRILRFLPPFTTGMAAGVVFGQGGNFTTIAAGTSADALSAPTQLAVDGVGNLFVAEFGNNRVARFDQPRSNGLPTLSSLSPGFVPVAGSTFVLTVNGSGFVNGSVVNYNGVARQTFYISDSRLVASIGTGDIQFPGTASITVFNPSPGGGTSNTATLTKYTRAGMDRIADRVLGQPDFVSSDYDNPKVGEERLADVSSAGMDAPGGIALDPVSGRLFISDQLNNRIQVYSSHANFNNTQSPVAVIGQPNEFSTLCNAGNTDASAKTVCFSAAGGVSGVAIDSAGALYVADGGNNRVLQFVPPFFTGMSATRVFGQDNFVNRLPNNGGTSASRLSGPRAVMIGGGTLFVADSNNNRVLGFVNPYGDSVADFVIGQADFFSVTFGNSASKISIPQGLALDRRGRLFVADTGNNRVLRFTPPFTNGANAETVIGQIDFVSAAPGLSQSTLNAPTALAVDNAGALLVADTNNNRIIRFSSPISSAMSASGLLGQSSFTIGTASTTSDGLFSPRGIAVDNGGHVHVADWYPGRTLAYDRPFPTPVQKADLSGNGKSDLVWRATDGGFSVWTMEGGTVAAFSYGVVTADWQVVATGDFNGDGKADLFWRRNDGATYLWFMNGSTPIGFVDTGVIALEYTPVAVADFNGDGKADILFRRANGQNYMWIMNNGLIQSQAYLPGSLGAEWVVQGADDVSGDGKADIVWRNANTGEVYLWVMNGATILQAFSLGVVAADWQIQGLADFNGDGNVDIQWRRANGENNVWLMNPNGVLQYVAQSSPGGDWVTQGLGDFNGDGKADIIFRHSVSGEVVIWFMEVNVPSSASSLGNPGAIWSIAQP